MAGPAVLQALPYKASAAITKFRCVKLTADETVAQASAVTDQVVGIAQVSVSSGEATSGKGVAVVTEGVSYAEAGAAITRGVLVTTDANGKVVTATANDVVVGQALKAAGADGEWIPVKLGVSGAGFTALA